MKHISQATAHCNEIELFKFQSVRLIGKWVRDYGISQIPKDEETLNILRSLPNIIPGSFVGWIGNYHPDKSAISIFGVFAPPGTPCPDGYVFKDISAELSSDVIAKGAYGENSCMSIVEKFDELGYQSPYCGIESYGWWEGELYLEGENFDAYSVLMPVRKIGRTLV
ncbi:MAG: hypothetical protein FWE06_09355 [Oscillospiraceae bacterium]|nr:hypothetical protein [Oscillospiraceae bacterium]